MSNIHQQCDTLIVIFWWSILMHTCKYSQNTLSLCFNKVIFVQLEVQCNVESQNWWYFFFFTLYVGFIFCLMYRYCNIKQWWCSYIENLLRDKVKCTHWYKKEKHKCFKFIYNCVLKVYWYLHAYSTIHVPICWFKCTCIGIYADHVINCWCFFLII